MLAIVSATTVRPTMKVEGKAAGRFGVQGVASIGFIGVYRGL